MKNVRFLFAAVVVAVSFSFYLLSTTGTALAGPGTSDYVRPLAEYQKNGETHYCCKNTQYTSCSASSLCQTEID